MKMRIYANKAPSSNFNNIDEWAERMKQLANELDYDIERDTEYRYYLSPKTSISTELLDITVYLSKKGDIFVPSCIAEMSHLNSDDFPSDTSIEQILSHWHEVGKLITLILKSRIYA